MELAHFKQYIVSVALLDKAITARERDKTAQILSIPLEESNSVRRFHMFPGPVKYKYHPEHQTAAM